MLLRLPAGRLTETEGLGRPVWISATLRRLACTLTLAVLLPVPTGCGARAHLRVPVTGRVTCEGEPLPAGSITFHSLGEDGAVVPGRTTAAYLKADGAYRTEAFLGAARVVVELPDIADLEQEAGENAGPMDDGALEARRELALARKAAAMACPLPAERVVEVPPGGGTIDIDLGAVEASHDSRVH